MQNKNQLGTNKERAIVENKDRDTVEYWQAIAKHWYRKFKVEEKDRLSSDQDTEVSKGMLNQYVNLYNADFKEKNAVKQLADDIHDSELAACNEIDGSFRTKGKHSFKITAVVAGLIIGVLFLYLYSQNVSFHEGVNQNMPIIMIGIVAFAVLYFVLIKNKKG